ncbi:hypothetical protein J2Z79_002692 [Symbiobacterium terraclitae]|uniref:Uncharacterized protein n=1 Tax=Symbiobacterium terraclitae TaxID=557451 RepID=A0ABS4JUS2_9FIRM|nr:hypothetical protein [Symbiobacterium terraclitae]
MCASAALVLLGCTHAAPPFSGDVPAAWQEQTGAGPAGGLPGWTTFTVEQALDAEGKSFEGVPFTIRFFAFNPELAEAYPHLTECATRFVLPVDP